MKKFNAAVAVGLLVCSSSASTGPIEINSAQVKLLTLSSDGLTRLSIENDQIVDVFSYPGTASEALSIQKGNLFLAPKGLENGLFVTIIGESGATQDLKINFQKRMTRPIIFKTKQKKQFSKKQIKRWLNQAILKRAPYGFWSVGHGCEKRFIEHIEAHESARFSNGVFSIAFFDVLNSSDDKLRINADDFIEEREVGKISKSTIQGKGAEKLVVVWKEEKK